LRQSGVSGGCACGWGDWRPLDSRLTFCRDHRAAARVSDWEREARARAMREQISSFRQQRGEPDAGRGARGDLRDERERQRDRERRDAGRREDEDIQRSRVRPTLPENCDLAFSPHVGLRAPLSISSSWLAAARVKCSWLASSGLAAARANALDIRDCSQMLKFPIDHHMFQTR